MVRSLKTYQLLDGYRGGAKYDVGALEETILRLGQMVEEIPEVAELDLNPLMALKEGEGEVVVDARIRVVESQRAVESTLHPVTFKPSPIFKSLNKGLSKYRESK